MRFKFIFCSKIMNAIEAMLYNVFNADNFLLKDNAILLFVCLESLIELFVFHNWS